MNTQISLSTVRYKEACEILECKLGSLQVMVSQGRLTRVPSLGNVGLLVREQIELFRGKKQVRYSLLSESEKTLWNECRDFAQGKLAPRQEVALQGGPFPFPMIERLAQAIERIEEKTNKLLPMAQLFQMMQDQATVKAH